MTVRHLYLFGCLYLVMLIATAVFTRATLRRIAGALAGAAVVGAAALGIVAAGEHAGWWHMTIIWEPYFLALLWADLVLVWSKYWNALKTKSQYDGAFP